MRLPGCPTGSVGGACDFDLGVVSSSPPIGHGDDFKILKTKERSDCHQYQEELLHEEEYSCACRKDLEQGRALSGSRRRTDKRAVQERGFH